MKKVLIIAFVILMLVGYNSSQNSDNTEKSPDRTIEVQQNRKNSVKNTNKKKAAKKKKSKCWIFVQVELWQGITAVFSEMPEIEDIYIDNKKIDYVNEDIDGNESPAYYSSYFKVSKGYHQLTLHISDGEELSSVIKVDNSTMFCSTGDYTNGKSMEDAAVYFFDCTLKKFGKEMELTQVDNSDDD